MHIATTACANRHPSLHSSHTSLTSTSSPTNARRIDDRPRRSRPRKAAVDRLHVVGRVGVDRAVAPEDGALPGHPLAVVADGACHPSPCEAQNA